MIDASSEFRALVSSNHTLLVRARLRLADGTVEELSGSDLMGVSMEEATSSDGSFDIGAAVIGSATVTLQNFGAQWDACDFTGASIALWVGKELTDGTTEWLRRGTWWVDQPDSYGGTIGLSCLDAPVDPRLRAHFGAMERNMWCTGGFLHAAGLTVHLDGSLAPLGEAPQREVFEFVPAAVQCDDDGRCRWEPRAGSDRFIFRVRDERAYPAAMTAALGELLRQL